ncbi:MAG: PilZ domain-containing protein [Candidatus Omnitrophica bacterium]|nr:PilZ domain-containing protein [Candidatus Omnitrophota bacterium]
MTEKREWKRVPLDFSAKCRLAGESTYHHVQLTDMHHQGFCFNSAVEFEKGRPIRMVVDHPVLGSLYLVGETLWVERVDGPESYRVGARLLIDDSVSAQNSLKLYGYLMPQ